MKTGKVTDVKTPPELTRMVGRSDSVSGGLSGIPGDKGRVAGLMTTVL